MIGEPSRSARESLQFGKEVMSMIHLDKKTLGTLEQLYQELLERGPVTAALDVRRIINKAS